MFYKEYICRLARVLFIKACKIALFVKQGSALLKKKIVFFFYTLHKLAKRGKTWKKLVADAFHLQQEVKAYKVLVAALEKRHVQTVASWCQQRLEDEQDVVALLQQHEREIESRIHAHHRVRNIVMLGVQTALFGTRRDINKVYERNKPQQNS